MAFVQTDAIPFETHTLYKHFTFTQQALCEVLQAAISGPSALLVRKEQLPAIRRALSIVDSAKYAKVGRAINTGENPYDYLDEVTADVKKGDVHVLRVAKLEPVYRDLLLERAVPLLEREDRIHAIAWNSIQACLLSVAIKRCNEVEGHKEETGTNFVYAILVDGLEGVSDEPGEWGKSKREEIVYH